MLTAIRKITDVLRGGGHPVEIGVSAGLGVLAGLVLGGNGLVVGLLLLMLVLNVNKPAFALALGPCAALGWLVAPLKFGAGRWLYSVEAVAALFEGLSNAPVGALMGFDTYSVAGGLLLGLPAAGAAGVASWWITRAFRMKMAAVAKARSGEGQRTPGKWAGSRPVRLVRRLVWGPEEPDYEKGLAARPKVLRVSGLVVLAVLVVLAGAGSLLDHGALVRGPLERGLTSAAGAEVDIAGLAFRPLAASLRVDGLKVTDADEPARNVLEAKVVVADVGVLGLLSRSIVIDEARISDFATGTPREEPGEIVQVKVEDQVEERVAKEPDATRPPPLDGASKIDRYVAWGEWQGRFESLSRVLKRLAAYRERARRPDADHPVTATEAEADEYSSIRAREVARTRPKLLVRKLVIEGVPIGGGPAGAAGTSTVDVYIENLAHPARLAPGPLVVRVRDRDGRGELELVAHPGERAKPIEVRGSFPGLPAGAVSEALSSALPATFEEGTMDVTLAGTAGRGWIDLTVEARCVGLVVKPRGRKRFLGLRPREIQDALEEIGELSFKLVVRGDPRKPRVRFVDGGLGRKLKEAALRTAKRRAGEEVREEREKLKQKARGRFEELLEEKTKKLPDADKVLKDIFRR